MENKYEVTETADGLWTCTITDKDGNYLTRREGFETEEDGKTWGINMIEIDYR